MGISLPLLGLSLFRLTWKFHEHRKKAQGLRSVARKGVSLLAREISKLDCWLSFQCLVFRCKEVSAGLGHSPRPLHSLEQHTEVVGIGVPQSLLRRQLCLPAQHWD